MPRICYVEKRFAASSMEIIDAANEILDEYARQGFVLTLRQLYYQFVARDMLPNTQRSYKRLGSIINDARLAGLIDWSYLEDRTRNLSVLEHFDDASDALTKLAGWYHVDYWANQEFRPEVWIEKEALAGVVEGVCQEHDVPFFSCRGYPSQSEVWRAAVRLNRHRSNRQRPYIIHFGDHDPSGIDMSRDIVDRMELMMGRPPRFDRVALNMDQIEEFKPPPNPAKITDSRAVGYIAEFGEESWELDALEPAEFRRLIEVHLGLIRDDDQWEADEQRKNEVQGRLRELAESWE